MFRRRAPDHDGARSEAPSAKENTVKKTDLKPGMIVVSLSTSRRTSVGSMNAMYMIVSADDFASKHGYGGNYYKATFVSGGVPVVSRDRKGILALRLPGTYLTEEEAESFDTHKYDDVAEAVNETTGQDEYEGSIAGHELTIIRPNIASMTLDAYVEQTREGYRQKKIGKARAESSRQAHKDLISEVNDLLSKLGGQSISVYPRSDMPTSVSFSGKNTQIVLDALRAAAGEKDGTVRP